MASGGRADMIQPMSRPKDEPCPQHPAKTLEVFCEKCFLLICFLCSYGDHKGHPTSLASERATSMLGELQEDEQELAKRKKKWSGDVTKVKDAQDKITKEYQQALKDLKKATALKVSATTIIRGRFAQQIYDQDMAAAEKGLPEAKNEVANIEGLQQEIKKLDSSSSLATMANLKPQVDAALGKKPPSCAAAEDSRRDVRERMRRLIPDDITKHDSSKALGTTPPPRVMARDYHVECYNYVTGKADDLPGAFREPDVTTPLSLYHDVTYIKAADAAALCAIVGGQPVLTGQLYRDRPCLVHDDGTVVSCRAWLIDIKGDDVRDKADRKNSGCCFLPASATVGDALRRYLGWRPASVINYLDNKPVNLKMTVKTWRDSFKYSGWTIKK